MAGAILAGIGRFARNENAMCAWGNHRQMSRDVVTGRVYNVWTTLRSYGIRGIGKGTAWTATRQSRGRA